MVGFQFDGDRIAPAGARVAVVIDGDDGNPRLQMTRDGLIQHGRAQRGERFADADTAEVIQSRHEVAQCCVVRDAEKEK